MHLIARLNESHCDAALAAPDSLAHLTPVNSAWLLSLVVRTHDLRVVAGLLVSQQRAEASEAAVYHELQGLADRLSPVAPGAAVVERHLRLAADALSRRFRRSPPKQSMLSGRQLRIATELLGSELQSRIPISLVAKRCGLSESHFRRGFHACTGLSPRQWRQERRLRYCRQQLLETNLPLSQISVQGGFPIQNYFSRVFTRTSGITPSDWRRVFQGAIKGFVAIQESPTPNDS